MMQRTFQHAEPRGLHVAVIMDGNGRWAALRGLPRTAGHRAGADAVRRAVEAAPACGVSTLTLYAFSSDNWRRPEREVNALMRLLRRYLSAEADELARRGVRLSVIGRRDRLAPHLRAAVEAAEARTAGGTGLRLRLAVDYSSRDAILRASSRHATEVSTTPHATEVSTTPADAADELGAPGVAVVGSPGRARRGGAEVSRECFARLLGEATHDSEPAADVDLLVRTGGEQRLSDFLLWECAYAELYFTPRMWPDFGRDDLAAAVAEFHGRERRFGRVPLAASL